METTKGVDTFLLWLLLLSIFVNFSTKRAYHISPNGISITFHRCDLYDGIDSFDLSTFHRIKSKYVTTTKKSVWLLLLLCVATLNHNRARLTIVNLRHSYRKKESHFVIKILEVCMEKLTKFEKFYYDTTSTYLVYQKPL